MTPDTIGTTWRKRDGIFTLSATVTSVSDDLVTVAFPLGARCVIARDHRTGGPRGYAKVEQTPALCDCTGAPHHWEAGCPVFGEVS